MMFSLFYFSTVDELLDANKYRLYLEGATFQMEEHRPWGSQNNNTFTGETKENN